MAERNDSDGVELVERLRIPREAGYLYHLKGVEVWRTPMRGTSGVAERLAVGSFERNPGYLYYLDTQGNVLRTPTSQRRALNLLGLEDHVWWKDLEADVGMGNDVYLRTLKEWAEISRGAFAPENIREEWKTETGPIQVTFQHRGREVIARPAYQDDWIDLRILGTINQQLSGDLRFCVLPSDQMALVIMLAPAEQRRLEREKDWRFLVL